MLRTLTVDRTFKRPGRRVTVQCCVLSGVASQDRAPCWCWASCRRGACSVDGMVSVIVVGTGAIDGSVSPWGSWMGHCSSQPERRPAAELLLANALGCARVCSSLEGLLAFAGTGLLVAMLCLPAIARGSLVCRAAPVGTGPGGEELVVTM
jgi:hypothetical protein